MSNSREAWEVETQQLLLELEDVPEPDVEELVGRTLRRVTAATTVTEIVDLTTSLLSLRVLAPLLDLVFLRVPRDEG